MCFYQQSCILKGGDNEVEKVTESKPNEAKIKASVGKLAAQGFLHRFKAKNGHETGTVCQACTSCYPCHDSD